MTDPLHAAILLIAPDGASRDRLGGVLDGIRVDHVADLPAAVEALRAAIARRRPYGLAVVAAASGVGRTPGDRERLWQMDSNLTVVVLDESDEARRADETAASWDPASRVLHVAWPPSETALAQLVGLVRQRRHLQDRLARWECDLASTRRALACAKEEVLDAARAKSEFMANVSHEIRTPMNAILGFTSLLMQEPLSDAQREKLLYVREAGETLLHAITHVLDYSKLTTGEVRLQPTLFDVDEAVHATIDEALPAVRNKGLTLRCHIEEAVPLRLQGDRNRFCQILTNLLDNAVKFTAHGSIHVRVTSDEETEKTVTLRVMVTDTGVGIPPDRQGIVFDGFCQADGSSTRRFEGVGVGLAICRQLVTLMGGQIGLQSAAGEGSTFWFTVTLRKPAASAAASGEPSCPRPRTTLVTASGEGTARAVDGAAPRPHILVADDDSLSRVLLEMLLGRAGCVVETVGNGREAITLFKSRQYDLVFMDVDMPEMDGREAIWLARQHEMTTGAHVPIVVLSAGALPADRQQCLEAGADRYITKPFNVDELLELIREYFPAIPRRGDAAPGADAPAPSADGLRERVEATVRALDAADLGGVESRAGAVREFARRAGYQGVADQAMRAQLAARRGDRALTERTVARLRQTVEEQFVSVQEPVS
ncbi:MAG: response regulator [Pirellulales bacterium]|nr:response regulator [Pirellulales bacterium]